MQKLLTQGKSPKAMFNGASIISENIQKPEPKTIHDYPIIRRSFTRACSTCWWLKISSSRMMMDCPAWASLKAIPWFGPSLPRERP